MVNGSLTTAPKSSVTMCFRDLSRQAGEENHQRERRAYHCRMNKVKTVTVIIDRNNGSNVATARREIKKIIDALETIGIRRIRVTRSMRSLKEDKVWRR